MHRLMQQDWETGNYNGLKPLFEKSGKPADRRSIILAFSSVESDLQARYPTMLYSDLLAKVYTTLEARLLDRWIGLGLPRDEAERRAFANDIPNARRVVRNSGPADLVLR